MRESTDILLEGVPGHVSMPEVQRRMLGVPGVTAVHDLHVWTVTSGLVAMSGHAIVPELDSHPEVLERIRAEMARLGIGHVTIQLEVQHECEEPRGRQRRAALRHRHQATGTEAAVPPSSSPPAFPSFPSFPSSPTLSCGIWTA